MKKTVFIMCGVVLLLIKVSVGQAHNNNYVEDDDDELQQPSPEFVTVGQKYSVAIGSTAVLPCKTNVSERASDQYILAWKKDNAVLTAGTVKVTMNPRVRITSAHYHHHRGDTEPGGSSSEDIVTIDQTLSSHISSYNLEIQNVHSNDAGQYSCQIGTIIPKEIVHNLEVLVPPKIDSMLPQTKNVELVKGAALRLTCKASGKPTPIITWSRKNNVMPNGELNITSGVLEVIHADRKTVGHYRCMASNGVEPIDTRDIFVNVLYAPEIDVERPFVHTGVGFETQLICIVHAEPSPQIVWYKDSTQLGITEQHSLQSRGNRYTLIIRNVTFGDLGNYTCQAANTFGKGRATVTLSGIPTICEFIDSPNIGSYHDHYNISWIVQSYEPILEYKLYFRTQSDINYAKRIRYEKRLNDDSNFMSTSSHFFYGKSIGRQNDLIAAEWESVTIIPENVMAKNQIFDSSANIFDYYHHSHSNKASFSMEGNVRHRQSFVIRNLRSAMSYETRVQARNVHGWNKLSNVFYFSTQADEGDNRNIEADFRPLTHKSSRSCTSHQQSIVAFNVFSLIISSWIWMWSL